MSRLSSTQPPSHAIIDSDGNEEQVEKISRGYQAVILAQLTRLLILAR
jgi:hypothetical protein